MGLTKINSKWLIIGTSNRFCLLMLMFHKECYWWERKTWKEIEEILFFVELEGKKWCRKKCIYSKDTKSYLNTWTTVEGCLSRGNWFHLTSETIFLSFKIHSSFNLIYRLHFYGFASIKWNSSHSSRNLTRNLLWRNETFSPAAFWVTCDRFHTHTQNHLMKIECEIEIESSKFSVIRKLWQKSQQQQTLTHQN